MPTKFPLKILQRIFSSLATFKFSICIFLLNKFVLETQKEPIRKKNKLETIMYDLIFRCPYSFRSFEYKFFLFFVSKWFLHRIILAFMLTHSLYTKIFAVYAECLYKRVFCFFYLWWWWWWGVYAMVTQMFAYNLLN